MNPNIYKQTGFVEKDENKMKVEINRLNDAYHFEAINEQGSKIQMDASPEIGGQNLGFRPMQLLLAGLGGCSSIDVVNILKKQKQDIKDVRVTVDGEREKDVIPSLFTDIHVHFHLSGKLDEEKVKKAIDLSVTKYCSVLKTLEKTARITHSYTITTG
ncbi:MAG TPA: OsmC family protein [Cytophagales bacterium]|nr:OsmC family protein [Cytophagales bacterium]